MTCEEMARAILAASSCAALHDLFADWRRRYSDRELLDHAECLKSEQFDLCYLGNDARDARRLAAGLTLLGRDAHLPYIEGLGVMAQADAARVIGRLRAAMARFDHAGGLFLAVGAQVAWARARGGWVAAASDCGGITVNDLAAMDEACRVLREAGERRRLANVHQNIALAYANLGRFRDAFDHWDRALEALQGLEDQGARHVAAMIKANQARVKLWQGDFDGAFAQLQELRVLFRETQRYGDAIVVAYKMVVSEQERGHLTEALRLVAEAHEEAVKRDLDNIAALLRLHQARIFLKLNRVDEAITASAQVLASRSVREDANELVTALCTYAEALERAGDRAGALRCLEQAEAVAGGREHPHTYQIALERAMLLLQPGKHVDAATRTVQASQARALAEEIAERSRAHNVMIHYRMAQLLAAEAMLAIGLATEARDRAQQLLKPEIEGIGPEVTYRCQLLLARVARRQGQLAVALAHYDAMVHTLGAFVQDLAYDRTADFLEDKDALYMEALSAALDAHEPARALGYLEQERARSAWLATSGGDAELDRLRREHRGVSASLLSDTLEADEAGAARERLRRLDGEIAERLADQARRIADQTTVDMSAILAAVPPGVAVIAYALAERELAIFVLAHGRIEVARVPGALARLRTHTRHLEARLDGYATAARSPDTVALSDGLPADPTLADIQADLRGLWAVLLEPVEASLPTDGEALLFVPHGELHALPLAALFDGARYVAERWVTCCLSSCQTLLPHAPTTPAAHEPTSPAPPASASLRSLLAIGYASATRDLPQVTREAMRVAAQTGGASLVGEHATLEQLRAEAPGRGYLHLAAHGAVRLDIPNSSYIELADGLLHPLDVQTLPLQECRLVVLSACETGRGRTAGGDDQVGLVRAFGLAGARAVLATLWRVDDVASIVLMELFYERLAAGATPASALSAAQRAFSAGAGGDALRSPYYWASYQLVAC